MMTSTSTNTGKLRLLLARISSRIASGEVVAVVVDDYPLLTEAEKRIILSELGA